MCLPLVSIQLFVLDCCCFTPTPYFESCFKRKVSYDTGANDVFPLRTTLYTRAKAASTIRWVFCDHRPIWLQMWNVHIKFLAMETMRGFRFVSEQSDSRAHFWGVFLLCLVWFCSDVYICIGVHICAYICICICLSMNICQWSLAFSKLCSIMNAYLLERALTTAEWNWP